MECTCIDSVRGDYSSEVFFWADFRDEIYNSEGSICLESLEMLTPKAKEKVIDLIDKYWKDHSE